MLPLLLLLQDREDLTRTVTLSVHCLFLTSSIDGFHYVQFTLQSYFPLPLPGNIRWGQRPTTDKSRHWNLFHPTFYDATLSDQFFRKDSFTRNSSLNFLDSFSSVRYSSVFLSSSLQRSDSLCVTLVDLYPSSNRRNSLSFLLPSTESSSRASPILLYWSWQCSAEYPVLRLVLLKIHISLPF